MNNKCGYFKLKNNNCLFLVRIYIIFVKMFETWCRYGYFNIENNIILAMY